MWRCPTCMTRYVWSKRMVDRTMREGWTRMRDDFETRRLRSEAEFERSFRKWSTTAAVVGAGVFLVVVGLVVWIVLRLT